MLNNTDNSHNYKLLNCYNLVIASIEVFIIIAITHASAYGCINLFAAIITSMIYSFGVLYFITNPFAILQTTTHLTCIVLSGYILYFGALECY